MKLTLLSTSDIHGYFPPTTFHQQNADEPLGLLKAASYILNYRKQAADDEVVLTIENGDFIQGSPMTYVAAKQQPKYQKIFSQLTNFIGYDAGILGNHEFNYGLDYLRNCSKDRQYPILAANIEGLSDVVDAPYQIFEQQGLKIGLIGLTTAYVPHWENPKNIPNITFKPIIEATKKTVAKIKADCDLIVVAYHGGFEHDLNTGEVEKAASTENEGYPLLAEIPEIDALITGHQHRLIAQDCLGRPVTQPGEKGRYVGQITLTLDENKKVIDHDSQLIAMTDQKVQPELQKRIYDWQKTTENWLDQPCGTSNTDLTIKDPLQARLHGHPFLSLINQVQMAATQTDIASTSLFNDDVPGLKKQITMRQVVTSYVYPNTLAVLKITGADLKAALEQSASYFKLTNNHQVTVADEFIHPKLQHYNYDYYSGIDYTIDLTKQKGHRISNITYHNQPIQDTQTFEVTMNSYRAVGGGNYDMFDSSKIVRELPLDMTELISDYLLKKPEITIKQPNNITIIK